VHRTSLLVPAVIGFTTAAHAATLTVSPDQPSYIVGDTVTLTITGDPQGTPASSIFGRLEYAAELTTTVGSEQTRHTWGGGANAAILGILNHGDGFADAFDQIIDLEAARAVDQVQIATVTLVADAVGTVEVSWSSDPSTGLDFFGLTAFDEPPIAASFTIPEPAPALAQSACLVVLLGLRRRVDRAPRKGVSDARDSTRRG